MFTFLQIVGVDSTDEGVYTCIADNGRGIPAEATVTLAVDPATEIAANIVETRDNDIVLSLGAPANLHCMAYGHPKPTVSW